MSNSKWQKYWEENQTFRVEMDKTKAKFYVLDMFPYPSGAGLHVGHPEGYTATDILCRYKRMRGFNVLHPMGWDAFGLPAEQYAIQTGTHPRDHHAEEHRQLSPADQALGLQLRLGAARFDTTDPDYYKWTQWIFLQLYKKASPISLRSPYWWCPELNTVLANEEVMATANPNAGFPVERRPFRQWMLHITAYAERLLEDLEELDWPESTKACRALDRPQRRGGSAFLELRHSVN